MCLVKVSRLEVIILNVSLCIFFVSCVCVCVCIARLRSYKMREVDVIAVVCVSFKYFTRHLTETSEVCVCVTVSSCRNE